MAETSLEQAATQAALEANWEEAISLNKQIVKDSPTDLGAWNRLGRAYSETGEIEKAKSAYREVLKRDPYNSIATKNVEKLKALNGTGAKITGSVALDPNLFLETPGKTKVLDLEDLAKPEVLATLHTGDKVKIGGNENSVRFDDASGARLGIYQGESAGKLAEMLRAGCVFDAYVKSAKLDSLKIFIREVKLTPKYEGTLTFPVQDNGFKPYVHESAMNSEPVIHADSDSTVETAEPEISEETEPKKPTPSVETLAEEESEDIEED